MKLIDTTCPHCGSALKIDPTNKNATCEYCGAALLIDDEVQHVQYDNAEEAGYKFEKGRQRAQAEVQRSSQRNTQYKQQQPKKKRKTWLWVLGWICIFPLPLTILLLRKKDMKPVLKYGIIAAAWIVYLIIGFAGSSGDNTEKNTAEHSSSSIVETIPIEEASTTQESEVPANTEDNSVETEVAPAVETDMDIVMRANHPTYYGSVVQSHDTWDDVEKGKIHFGDKNYGNNDKPILSMDAYRNSDIIRLILINFMNFEDSPVVSVDEALKIAASYMPYDVMDQYYEFKGSEIIAPDESRKEDASYYIVSYRLTDEGSKAYYAKEHEYSGTIDVIIQVKDEAVENIDITFGTPRWMSSLNQNSYHKVEWSCNLYDFRN